VFFFSSNVEKSFRILCIVFYSRLDDDVTKICKNETSFKITNPDRFVPQPQICYHKMYTKNASTLGQVDQ